MSIYDMAIVGGGPAGLTAGIYGARAKLKTIIFEKASVGGQAFVTKELVNYPGFGNTTGPDLMKAIADHAKQFGAEILNDEVISLELDSEIKVLTTKKGNEYKAQSVVLALGAQPRLLNIPGEKEYRGSGVSYCATCDGELYSGLQVVVVGNGDAAIEEAMYITKFASKVMVIVIHDEGILDCNKLSADKAFKNNKLEFVWNSVLTEIKGNDDDEVNAVMIKNLKTGKSTELKTDGVFIYVGMIPCTEVLKEKVKLNERGYIITNYQLETSVEGVFAAGDAREKYLRQVVTAANDGAIAGVAAERYLSEADNFRESVLKSPRPVILAFWNPAHEKSQTFIAMTEKVISGAGDEFNLVKIDTSRNQQIAAKYKVAQIPSALVLKRGEVCKRISGEEELKSLLKKVTKRLG